MYELLTGTTPLDRKRLQAAGIEEMMRMIREEEPQKPSTQIDSSDDLPAVAKQRNTEPRRLSTLVRGDLDWIVMKSLEKDRNRRYGTAQDLASDIQRYLNDEPVTASPPSLVYRARKFATRNRAAVISGSLAGMILLLMLGSGLQYRMNYAQRKIDQFKREQAELDAKAQHDLRIREVSLRTTDIPEIEQLIAEQSYSEAFAKLNAALKDFPGDSKLLYLLQKISIPCSIQTEPPDATVYLKVYGMAEAAWQKLQSTTPCSESVAKTFYHYRIELDGYETIEGCAGPELIEIERTLDRAGSIPEGMVRVQGSDSGPINDDFFIDRTEVTNEQYRAFVDAGGYANKSFWKHSFFEEGKELSWDEAMKRFVDQSGKPGPATWSDGSFPEGKANHPVNGVSWYEAAAYAEFLGNGKTLPTIHHWRAASGDFAPYLIAASNFMRDGTSPVASFHGVGPFGTYDAAGNVAEWCSTGTGGFSFRHAAGGAFGKPDYMFTATNATASFFREDTMGFRCAKYTTAPDRALFADEIESIPYHYLSDPATDDEFTMFRDMYSYTRRPLNADEREGRETESWKERIVTIDSAYGSRLVIHLFEPKLETSNNQVLIGFPGTAARNRPNFGISQYSLGSVEKLIKSGRTVAWPVYAGMYGRSGSIWDKTIAIQQSQDIGRSIDYLKESERYASSDIGYIGFSNGAARGPILIAMEPRISLGILVNGGLFHNNNKKELDAYNFAPRVRVPILMINGANDSSLSGEHLAETSA